MLLLLRDQGVTQLLKFAPPIFLTITFVNLLFNLIVGSRKSLKDLRFLINLPIFTLFVFSNRL
jgi:hypothetical protein